MEPKGLPRAAVVRAPATRQAEGNFCGRGQGDPDVAGIGS